VFASLAPSSAEEQAWPLPEAECVVAADVPPREAACLVSEQLPGGWSRVGLAPLRTDGWAARQDDLSPAQADLVQAQPLESGLSPAEYSAAVSVSTLPPAVDWFRDDLA
jgi:hypothetical protein